MANKKKTTKKTTSKKNTKTNSVKAASKKVEKELKEKKLKEEEELEEEYEDYDDYSDDEEYEDEEFDEESFEDEDYNEDDYDDEDEDELEEEEEERPAKREKTEMSESGKKTLIIVVVAILAFFIISLVLPTTSSTVPKNETETETGTSDYKNPSVSEWLSEAKKGTVVTVVASSTCPHCHEYRPVITRLAEENKFKMYFFEVDQLESADQQLLLGSFTLPDYDGGVPYTFVVEKGKVKGTVTGFGDESETVKFLKDNKIMK